MITGTSFRNARFDAGWTQQEAAEKIGVVLKTIGNWERGKDTPIHRRHWKAVSDVLPGALVREGREAAEALQAQKRKIAQQLSDLRVSSMRDEQARMTPEALLDQQYDLYDGAVSALDWLEIAILAGVSTRTITDTARDVVQVAVESKTLLLKGDTVDPMEAILYRAGTITTRARERDTFGERTDTTDGGDLHTVALDEYQLAAEQDGEAPDMDLREP